MYFRHSARLGALLLVGAVGCGLLSSDITKITFDLPTKQYTFAAPAGVPAQAVPCGPGTPLPTCPAIGALTVSCDDGVCAAHVPFSKSQTMDLRKEVPQLMSVSNQSLADITLASLSYAVSNTTNVTIPEIVLFLAPEGVTDPSDAAAERFGKVPAVPAQMSASGTVEKEDGADALFIKYGHAFGTPFNFIAATTVVIPSGTASGGMVEVTINGKVSAKLSL